MSMRDKIAEIIFKDVLTTMNIDGMGPYNAADAIIAALEAERDQWEAAYDKSAEMVKECAGWHGDAEGRAAVAEQRIAELEAMNAELVEALEDAKACMASMLGIHGYPLETWEGAALLKTEAALAKAKATQ